MSSNKPKPTIKSLEKQNLCLNERILSLKSLTSELRGEVRSTKRKYEYNKERKEYYKSEYKRLKKLLSSANVRSETEASLLFNSGQKAKHHSYNLFLVSLCVNIQSYGQNSLRACVRVLLCIQLCFGLPKTKVPCASTIRTWVCKLGKYRIDYLSSVEGKWVCWVDESICIGAEKVLLILGIPEKRLFQEDSLKLSQVSIMYMDVSHTWQGEDIADIFCDL